MYLLQERPVEAVLDPFDPNTLVLPEVHELHLSNRDDSLTCLVDHIDYAWAIQFVWHMNKGKSGKVYAARCTRRSNGGGWENAPLIRWWLHVEIMRRSGIKPASIKHKLVDHWNGESLDNRRCNLRWATHSENTHNVHGSAYRQHDVLLSVFQASIVGTGAIPRDHNVADVALPSRAADVDALPFAWLEPERDFGTSNR